MAPPRPPGRSRPARGAAPATRPSGSVSRAPPVPVTSCGARPSATTAPSCGVDDQHLGGLGRAVHAGDELTCGRPSALVCCAPQPIARGERSGRPHARARRTSSPSACGRSATRATIPSASRPGPGLKPADSVRKLAELGAYGVCFHDNDLIPLGTDDSEAERIKGDFKAALDETGMKVSMATTNLFTHPVFKDGAFTSNDRDVRRYAIQKTMRGIDLGAELGRAALHLLGRARGSGGRRRQAGPRRARALPRGTRLPVRVRARPGLRHAHRARAEAQRAARRHLPARPSATCWPSSSDSSIPRWWA